MVIFNPKIIKYGKIVHVTPYMLFLVGGALVVLDMGGTTNSVGGLLVLGLLIVLVDGASYYEWRKEQ
jgi:hypothetical protein